MLHQTDNLLTVLYLRLSREDENEGDSNSIVNQKELLLRYAQEHGFTNIKIISDDGYSGVSFDRPGFQELLSLANAGKVGVIITKDLSRLGRNYIEVGKYSEVLFPGLGIDISPSTMDLTRMIWTEMSLRPSKISSTSGTRGIPARRFGQSSEPKPQAERRYAPKHPTVTESVRRANRTM